MYKIDIPHKKSNLNSNFKLHESTFYYGTILILETRL